MIATKKAKLIRKHLGANTPGWIVKNCIALLKEYEEIEWCDVPEEQANGVNTENEPSINYDGVLATGLTNEQILDEATRRKANVALQYEDYSLETWTVATKLLPHRKAYLLDDGSIRKFRIEYEM